MNKIGFGFLRLPKVGEEGKEDIDWDLMYKLVDLYVEKGGTYFDTAYTYLNGLSEEAIKKAVIQRFPRDKVKIADKMPSWKLTSREDCRKYFDEQLERCGVNYFDTYLLHWLNKTNYEISEKYGEFQFLEQMKKEGKVGKTGFSYHDSSKLLDEILTKHPEVDIVQLQINYLDWDSDSVEAKKCYEVAVKHNKSVVVMEPIKGGTLVNLPDKAQNELNKLGTDYSNASYALRFAQSLENVSIVLSGMNQIEQIQENMQDTDILNDTEKAVLKNVSAIIKEETAVPCTGCSYCTSTCPKKIAIPKYFSLYNEYSRNPEDGWKIQPVYEGLTQTHGKASDCILCKQCERNCPQKLTITEYLKAVAKAFE